MTVDLSTLHTLLSIAGRPSYVKHASEQENRDPAAATACADGFGGRFPCTDREQTYVSALKIAAAQADGEDVEDALVGIRKFARFWQIGDDVDAALTKLGQHFEPVEIPDDAYALDVEVRGERLRKYAAFNDPSTYRAAEGFYENRFRYPLEWREKVARVLLKRAGEFGTVIPEHINDYLYKAAGFGFPTPESIEAGLIDRLNRLPPNRKEASVKLASALGTIADSPHLRYNHDLVRDVLDITDRFDREMKLAAHYESGDVSLPEEMLGITTAMIKRAGEVEHDMVRLQNGESVNIHHLPKSALEAVDPALALMKTARLAKVLPTLPSPDAAVLCKAAGVGKKAPGIRRPGLGKAAQEMMLPPDPAMAQGGGGMPEAPMPGPGAIPGAPMPGEGGAPIDEPGQAEPAPLPSTPGQEAKPGDVGGGMSGDPDAMAPGSHPVSPGLDDPGMGPMDGPLDAGGVGILDDPDITEQASPTGQDQQSSEILSAGSAGDDTSGVGTGLGESLGLGPAGRAVMQDDISGMPQSI